MSDIDWKFIKGKEGNETKAYIPKDKSGKVLGKSGVTIGSGFDLGQQRHLDFLSDENDKLKLTPYLGKTKEDAERFLSDNPLELDEEAVARINQDVTRYKEGQLKEYWEKRSDTPWEDLSTEQRTVIASVGFQYNLDKTPKFISAATEGRWDDVLSELRNFGDKYSTRRNSEADLLESYLYPKEDEIIAQGKPEASDSDVSPEKNIGNYIDDFLNAISNTAEASMVNQLDLEKPEIVEAEKDITDVSKEISEDTQDQPKNLFEQVEANRAMNESDFPVVPSDEEIDTSFLKTINAHFMGDNILGDALKQYTEKAIGPSFGPYDPDFKPSEDPELMELAKDYQLIPDVAERFAEISHNKSHYLELLNEYKGYRETEQYLAQAFGQDFWTTLGIGFIAEGINLTNLLVPQGAVLKGIGKISKTAARFGKAAKGMNSIQALGRRLAVSLADSTVENAVNELLLTEFATTERDDQLRSIAMSMVVSTGFSGLLGGIGKLKADKNATKQIGKFMADITRIGKKLDNEILLNKMNKVIDAEDLKLGRGETLSTALRDGLKKIRDDLKLEIEGESMRAKYEQDLHTFKKGELDRLTKTKAKEEAIVLDEFSNKSKKIIEARDKVIEDLKKSTISKSKKKSRSFRKKVLNKINKETGDQLKALEAQRVSKLEEIKTKFDEKALKIDEAELPIKDYADVEELKKAFDMQGSDVDFKVLKDTIEGTETQSIGAARVGAPLKRQGTELGKALKNLSPEVRKVVLKTITKDDKGIQIVPDMLDKFSIGRKIKNNSNFQRWFLNKNALAKGDNPIASAFYTEFAPSYGKAEGSLDVFTAKEAITNQFAGEIPRMQSEMLNELSALDIKTRTLSEQGLQIKMLRDFIEDPEGFKSRQGITPEITEVYQKYADRFNDLNRRFVERAKKSGLVGTEDLEHIDNYIHRSWNNYKAREFKDAFGEEALVELIYEAFRMRKVAQGIDFDAAKLQAKSRKFVFGLLSVDMEDTAKTQAWGNLIDSLSREAEAKGLSKSENKLIAAKKATKDARQAMKEFGLNGARKDLDINAKITIDGQELSIKDLLDDNFFETQQKYFSNHSGQIALAEAGFKDPEKLLEFLDGAVKYEVAKGRPDAAAYVKDALGQDIGSLIGGYRVASLNESPNTNALVKLAQKYNFTRLLQYTGVNSMGELGSVPTDFGFGNTVKMITSNINNKLSTRLSFLKPNEMVKELTEANRALTGVGNEGMLQSLVIGSKGRALRSTKGQKFERIFLDEASRFTRLSSGIERGVREITVNSAAMSLFNRLAGNKEPSIFFGGLSNTNLTEMGLGKFKNKKFIPNDTYKLLKKAFELSDVDSKGALVRLNHEKWTDDMRTAYSKSINKIVNHHMVTADSTSSKTWHNSVFGRMLNQFRSFEINATSKVTGRAVAVLGTSIKNGDTVEMAKAAQKLIFNTIFGKISIVSYAAISQLGKEDWDEKVTEAIWNDDAGIANVIEPFLRTSLGTPFKPVFEVAGLADSVSTTGRSYKGVKDPFMTSPTGQLFSGAYGVGSDIGQGNFVEAAKGAWKLSPYHRIWGIHVLSNMILEQ